MPDNLRMVTGVVLLQIACSMAYAEDEVRLLYAQQGEEGCDVGVWEARASDSILLAEIHSCPEYLFATPDGETVFVSDGEALRLINTRTAAELQVVSLPSMDYHDWGPLAEVQMHPKNLEAMDEHVFQPTAAGILDDGALALQLQMYGPAGGSLMYLLSYEDNEWTLRDSKSCGNWEFPCDFGALRFLSSLAWTWPESRRVWHDDITRSPYFVSKTDASQNPDNDHWETRIRTLVFEIDGVRSELEYFTNPSAHFDLDYTFNVDLRVGDGPKVNLSGNQCVTSVVGRYILIDEFFLGRREVTDLGTGETMIDDLAAAVWLNQGVSQASRPVRRRHLFQ